MLSQILLVLVAIASGYQLFSLVCAWMFARWRRRELARGSRVDPGRLPPVTILKPLHGAVPETYDNLASVCRIDYPSLQIVFGVADLDDPVVPIVNRVRRDFPQREIDLVVSDRSIGSNAKVSNLANMLEHARHEVLVIADSDIRVPENYLTALVPYLEQPGAGLVTCMYRAVGGSSFASQLEALFINTDFGPMVTVARQVETQSYAFGATICLRRAVLAEIGGLEALADYLADDYQMGYLTVAAGYHSVLAPIVVETVLDLDTMDDVFAHQLRWARTYRICRPRGYLAAFVTHSTMWSCAYLIAAHARPGAWAIFAAAVGTRMLAGGLIADRVLGVKDIWRRLWLVPFKDLFISTIAALAFVGNTVRWGDTRYVVSPDGRMAPVLGAEERPAESDGATA
ncbi:MAG TPA: bacteriohopanetetrol glucosamine biosynthesis glycosyltransferase HpnI [Candidatus Bathyarchaeia archaeon]|nr:bacteriohopanetetrol glucosamine biosynthesis glycosyltransferase HpnI [Candidatus Bathyarchaeia archaeon]